MADRHAWPIHLDHCFMRICLDHAAGARWDCLIARPAIRHATDAQLAAAVAVAERMAADPACVAALNHASLAMRGRR